MDSFLYIDAYCMVNLPALANGLSIAVGPVHTPLQVACNTCSALHTCAVHTPLQVACNTCSALHTCARVPAAGRQKKGSALVTLGSRSPPSRAAQDKGKGHTLVTWNLASEVSPYSHCIAWQEVIHECWHSVWINGWLCLEGLARRNTDLGRCNTVYACERWDGWMDGDACQIYILSML